MKKSISKIIITGIVGLMFVCLAASAYSEEITKIKGFYIGMSIDDGLKNLERLGFKGYKIEENSVQKEDQIIKYYFIAGYGQFDTLRLQTDANSRKVSRIKLSGNVTRNIFNARGISALIFRKLFLEAYDIPQAAPYGNHEEWDYTDLRDGFRVKITKSLSMEIIKTSKLNQLQFD